LEDCNIYKITVLRFGVTDGDSDGSERVGIMLSVDTAKFTTI